MRTEKYKCNTTLILVQYACQLEDSFLEFIKTNTTINLYKHNRNKKCIFLTIVDLIVHHF